MIVISGALVLVAFVLLIAGLFTDSGLTLIYLCIGTSVVSAIFLTVGYFQRRGEVVTAGGPDEQAVGAGPAPVEAPTAPTEYAAYAPPASAPPSAYPEPVVEGYRYEDSAEAEPDDLDEEYDDYEEDPARTVFVVEGRPRYHVEDCRYLDGKEYEPLDVDIAREEGFTPCGVCRPDEALAAYAAADAEDEQDEFDEDGVDEDLEADLPEDVPDLTKAPPVPVAASVRVSPVARSEPAELEDDEAQYDEAEDDEAQYDEAEDEEGVGAGLGPDEESAAPHAGPEAEPAARPSRIAALAQRSSRPTTSAGTALKGPPAPAEQAPQAEAEPAFPSRVRAPAKRPAATAAAEGGAAEGGAAARKNTVLVIPDRGKYHRPECRYVRGNTDAIERAKTTARRQGYAPCGVCKP